MSGMEDNDKQPSHSEHPLEDAEYPVQDTELEALQRRVAELEALEVEHERYVEALRRRTEELEALRQVGLSLATELDLNALLHTIVSQAIALAGGTAGGLYLYRPERDLLEWSMAIGRDLLPLGSTLSKGEGLSGQVWETGKPLFTDLTGFQNLPGLGGDAWAAIVGVPLHRGGKFLGVLNVLSETAGAFTAGDAGLLRLFASQAAVAIENAALYEAERSARRQLGDLASYLQTAREKERTRIAREIHDVFGQILTALKMDLSWLSRRLPQDQPQLAAKAVTMSDLVDSAIHTVRRVATELRPGLLDDLGLVAAIEWQAEAFAVRTGIDVELDLGGADPTGTQTGVPEEAVPYPLDTVEDGGADAGSATGRDLATAIFRIFQETLTNVGRHAGATHLQVKLETTAGQLLLTVRDNGAGITSEQINDPRSLGLVGMRERARHWGGEVDIQGTPGQGTTVIVRVPLIHGTALY
jgi:signal transduction histidine kinase